MAIVSTGLYACERRKTIKLEEQMYKKTIKPAFSETRRTKGKKSAVHQENPVELYISAAALSYSLRGRHKKGRGGGEKRKREKGKRAFPSFINNLFHSSLSLTDDACHILSPSVQKTCYQFQLPEEAKTKFYI